ncbi:hypothetical protein [Pseudonocardia sp. NPDC049154]|uniref:hypothetical protein n=1 Tax=Pseudonocardia sp. NPDC049154 TaxID=3155501 RepID=UPI00340389B3
MQAVRPTRVEALLGVAVFCLVAAAVVSDAGPGGRSIFGDVLAFAFAVGFGALLLVARRWPVPVLLMTAAGIVVYYVLDLPPIGLAAPIAATLYVAAERGRAPWALGVAGSLLAQRDPLAHAVQAVAGLDGDPAAGGGRRVRGSVIAPAPAAPIAAHPRTRRHNAGLAHLGHFGSWKAIVEAKGEDDGDIGRPGAGAISVLAVRWAGQPGGLAATLRPPRAAAARPPDLRPTAAE